MMSASMQTVFTSRQIFHMIPLPSYLQEPPKTIVYQNTEPNL